MFYQHQKKIIDGDPKRAGLFLGTGSGKTRISLMLAHGNTLVIAPKTQVEDKNWERELENILKKINNFAITNKVFSLKSLCVISKETFRRDWEKLPAFDTVIVDEAHTCLGVTPNTRQRNKVIIPKASQLFEALDNYLQKHNPERFYLCTATILRSPMTVWAAAKLLGRNWDFYQFRHTFYVKLPMPGREVYTPKTDEATKERLANSVKKLGYVGRLEDYFDVPEQTYKTIWLDTTQKQKDRIKEMKIEYPEPIVRFGKIHQIENGVLTGDEFSAPETFDNEKLDTLLDLALEFPRMVVFAKFTAQIEAIRSAMAEKGYKVLVMTGDTKDRGSIIAEANNSNQCVFIAQAQISAGWELPQFPVMVFASRTYSFVDYDQAIGRIQRANNIKKNLYINLVVKGGSDEAVHDCLDQKKDFNEKLYVSKL